MNKIIIGIIAVLLACAACEDAMDRNYDAGPEKYYPPKVEDVSALSGYKRTVVSWNFSVENVNTAQQILITIEGLAIGYADTIFVNELVDSYELTDLPGDVNYTINVQTVDAEGNYSIIEPSGEQTAHVYVQGDSFGEGLKPREITSAVIQGDSMSIALAAGTPLTLGSEFSFTNATTGEEIVVVSEPETNNVVLSDVDFSKTVKYRTFHVPELDFLDQYPSEWEELNVSQDIMDIANTVSLKNIIGGVKIDWKNPSGTEIIVDVMYMLNGEEKTVSFSSTEIDGSEIVSGLENGIQDITVVISDATNKGIAQTISTNIQEAVKLDNSGWSVIDESLSRPDYPASNFIDGNYATFWHTPNAAHVSPTGETPPYPHYITVNLGASKTIASIKLFRRENNGIGPTLHEIYLSSDNINFTKVGTYSGSIPDNNGVIVAVEEHTAQYVKYVAVEGPNYFTNMAEMEVYGLE